VGSHKEDTTVVVVSYSGKEINAKLVYYGAGLSGKTTNLEAIYEAVPETSRGKMVSMKTQSDRTLFFDLLPLDLGEIMGFKTRFLLYTVPGQVFYNATRKLVLKGADAIVFVADSEVGKMEENKESLQNLRDNLREYKLELDDIPWVIQYNKRDLPNVYTLDELNAELNPGGKAPCFEAVATQGKGVFETFRGISHLLMEKVTKDLRRAPGATTTAPREVAKPEEPAAPTRPATLPGLGGSGFSTIPAGPSRLMERPAAPAPVAAGTPGETGMDYGRQIDFSEDVPVMREPATAPAARAPAPSHAPAPAKPAAPAPAKPAAPKPAAREPAAAPRPAPAHAEPAAPSRAAAPSIHNAPAATAPAESAAESSASIVVPIVFPVNGTTGEIVIRIVLKPAE
jgi:signal recognition particle receptor subunit beta